MFSVYTPPLAPELGDCFRIPRKVRAISHGMFEINVTSWLGHAFNTIQFYRGSNLVKPKEEMYNQKGKNPHNEEVSLSGILLEHISSDSTETIGI
jgi:hypothetical protein